MSAQQMSFISIDSIVNDYLEESESSINKYAKCWQLCFRGMEELGLTFFYQIRSVKLTVNANNTVNLPPDFLQYTKIGVLNARGEIFDLKFNDKLTFFADQAANRKEVSIDDKILVDWYNVNSPYFYNYWQGDVFTNLYGQPSGGLYVGSYNIDVNNGLILLNENYSYDYLMLEYIASPNPQVSYSVPMQFREALIAWLWWKDNKKTNVKRGQVGISRDLKSDFYNERRLANAKWRPLRLNDAYQLNLDMERLTVKA